MQAARHEGATMIVGEPRPLATNEGNHRDQPSRAVNPNPAAVPPMHHATT